MPDLPLLKDVPAVDHWPMPVKDFLANADRHLQRSDVVLCRGQSLFSRSIRWATKSPFSHAALVFLIPQFDAGFRNTFLIESVPNGVDVTDLRHYVVDRAGDYDVVVRRLDQPWFTEDVQRTVRGRMLDFIKADYDFATVWTIAKSVFERILFGIHARVSGLENALRAAHAKDKLAPAQFICSGFVQYGMAATVRQLVEDGKLPASCIEAVLFHPGLTVDSDVDALLSTTPEDIAATDKLQWMYVFTKKQVHRVATRAEVDRLLGVK